ncbi:hypothetical protein HMPREF0080_00780 [Anaeroglobus geminatus F0357]|uniref:Uncharacterized protein n=1 Tax=Anaeroglobus geminatus F0357 TaxID=861450 RepID=G9YGL3_9FIRM|nr:hypothetical protein HMPREF0080_00780 [Anaeroglobus geminatus F0357]
MNTLCLHIHRNFYRGCSKLIERFVFGHMNRISTCCQHYFK